MRPIRCSTLVLILAASAGAQEAPKAARPAPARPLSGLTLDEARRSFTLADADHTGSLNAAEAATDGLDAAAFSAADADLDLALSQDEFIVADESRAARSAAGAAPDLSAESTRVLALRRARKAEELKTRRDSTGPGAARTAGQRAELPAPAAPAPVAAPVPAAGGPAALRRAVAPETPEAKEQRTAEEVRADILRRVRNSELGEEDARKQLAEIDRRIASTAGQPAASPGNATGATGEFQESELRAIEETLHRRLRNSGLESDQARERYEATLRRLQNARGSNPPVPPQSGEPGTAPAPEGFRARLGDAQSDLTRRLRNAEALPDKGSAEQAAQVKRFRNAADSLKTGSPGTDAQSVPGAPQTQAAPLQPVPAAPSPARSGNEPPQAPAPAAPVRRAADERAPAAPPVEGPRKAAPIRPPDQPVAPPPADGSKPEPVRPPAKGTRPATPPDGRPKGRG